MTTEALRIRALLREQDRLEAQQAKVSGELRTLARQYWLGKGISVMPRSERLREAVEADCAAMEAELTPLEYAITHNGKCFE